MKTKDPFPSDWFCLAWDTGIALGAIALIALAVVVGWVGVP